MLHKIKKTLFILPLLWISSSMTAQNQVNGFYPEKNKFTIAPSYTYKNYKKFYRGTELTEGNPGPIGGSPISSYITNLYADYAFTDWLSACVNLPYISVSADNGDLDPVKQESSVKGIQDLSIYLKGKIIKEKFESIGVLALGAAVGASIPVGDYDERGILSLGNNATTLNGNLLAQLTFNNNFFTELQGGYSLRENSDFEVPNAMVYAAKLGYFNDFLYAHVQLAIQNSLDGFDIGTPEFVAAGSAAALAETEVDFTNLNFNLYIPIYKKMIGISSTYNQTIAGRNFGRESSFSVGIVYQNK